MVYKPTNITGGPHPVWVNGDMFTYNYGLMGIINHVLWVICLLPKKSSRIFPFWRSFSAVQWSGVELRASRPVGGFHKAARRGCPQKHRGVP